MGWMDIGTAFLFENRVFSVPQKIAKTGKMGEIEKTGRLESSFCFGLAGSQVGLEESFVFVGEGGCEEEVGAVAGGLG